MTGGRADGPVGKRSGGTFQMAMRGLRIPNFARFFVGQSISTLGTWFQNLAMSLVVLELTGSPLALGMVTAAQFGPFVVAGPIAGVVADRHGSRRLLVGAALGGTVITLTLAVVTASGQLTLPRLLVAAVAIGVVNSVERPVGQSFLRELMGPELVPNGVAMLTVSQSVARLLGPAVAGVVYGLAGAAVCFALNALSFLGAAAMLMAVRQTDLVRRPLVSRAEGRLRVAWQHVRGNAPLRRILVVNAFVGLLALNFLATIDSIVYLSLDGSATMVGAAHALNAVGAVGGGLVMSSVDRRLTPYAPWVCLFFAAVIAVQASAPTLALFLVASPLFGVGFAVYSNTMYSSAQSESDPAMLGRVMSLVLLGHVGTTPVGGLLIGWVMEVSSPRAGMYVGAAGALAGGVYLLLAGRRPA